MIHDRISMGHPDWVMLGTPADEPGKVWLYASRKLAWADLEHEAQAVEPWFDAPPFIASRDIRIIAHVRRFVIIEAPTYGQALEALFKQWSPDNPAAPEPAQITGTQALPPGGTS